MGGKPCIRGMRVTVGIIVGQIGAGHTIEQLLADYPYFQREDNLQALRVAWRRARSYSPSRMKPLDRYWGPNENFVLVSLWRRFWLLPPGSWLLGVSGAEPLAS
jgi:uncharacterized protein (DUF433 family)